MLKLFKRMRSFMKRSWTVAAPSAWVDKAFSYLQLSLFLRKAGSQTVGNTSCQFIPVCVCVRETVCPPCSSAAGRYLFLNAIANQLRYPNSHTHYFSCTMLYLFAEANTEAIQEQITRWAGGPSAFPFASACVLALWAQTIFAFGFQGSLGTTDCK